MLLPFLGQGGDVFFFVQDNALPYTTAATLRVLHDVQ